MKIFVAHSSQHKFSQKLYLPLRRSTLNKEHVIFLPQEKGKEVITKDIIQNSDLLIAEVSLPSTGMGIEIGWAGAFNIPIICLYEEGKHYSSSLNFTTNKFISYNNSEDMIKRLTSEINKLKK